MEEQASGERRVAASVGEITATVEELSSSTKTGCYQCGVCSKIAEDSDDGQQGRNPFPHPSVLWRISKESTRIA